MRQLVYSLLCILACAGFLSAAEIHDVITRGDLAAAQALLEANPELITAVAANGRTPLHEAAYAGHTAIVEWLLSKGADFNATTPSGSTPLHGAAVYGHGEALRLLVAKGGNVNTANQAGYTPFINSCIFGDTNTVRFCINAGGDINAVKGQGINALLQAAQAGKSDVIRLLIEAGASPATVDQRGNGILHYSVHAGDTAVVALAINKGAQVNAANIMGQTPLFWALYPGNMDVIRRLIQAGADVNRIDSLGEIPLWSAIGAGSAPCVSILLGNGARTAYRNAETGYSLLHRAVIGGDKDIVEPLLRKMTEINSADNYGLTALDYAKKYGHKQIAQLLTSRGAIAKAAGGKNESLSWLNKPVADKEAALCYLGHCGYAVKTKNHFLIFDYWRGRGYPTEPSLANGHIDPNQLKGENVTVFVSHEHMDHYDSSIYGWRDALPGLTYVFGFQPEQLAEELRQGYAGQKYEYVPPRSSKTIGDMEVTTIRANDAGEGFVVRVDGLTIYHAGDHAGWVPDNEEEFTSEIDFIAEKYGTVDMAFVNVTGCRLQDTIALAGSTEYTLDKLSPKVMIPTHGLNHEEVYVTFSNKMRPKFPDVFYFCPRIRGDVGQYIGGQTPPRLETM